MTFFTLAPPNLTSNFTYTNHCQLYQIRYADDLLNEPSAKICISLFYAIVWLLGISGNILVIYVGFTTRLAFNVRSMFVLTLAFSDIFVGVTSLPVTAVTNVMRIWIFPDLLCSYIGFLQALPIFVSSFTLCAIAVDRYLLIVFPQKRYVTYNTAVACLLAVLTLAIILASPMAFQMKMQEFPLICGMFCQENLDKTAWLQNRSWYGISVTLLQFALPVAISVLCYWKISQRLNVQIRARLKREVLVPAAEKRLIERRRRTTRMMVLMVATYVAVWLPFNVVNLLGDLTNWLEVTNTEGVQAYPLLSAVAHVLAMTSMVWNPIIYCWFTEPFRTALKSICVFRSRAGSHSGSNSTVCSPKPMRKV